MSTGIRLVLALINIGQDLIHFPIRATDVQYFFLYMTSTYVEYFLHSVLILAAIVDSTLQYTERNKKKWGSTLKTKESVRDVAYVLKSFAGCIPASLSVFPRSTMTITLIRKKCLVKLNE